MESNQTQQAQSGQPITNTVNVVLTPQKSAGVAILLAFFFGPIGMLYSTVVGAVVMFFVNILALLFTAGIGLILTWPIGIVWAAIAAKKIK